eukprot:1305880-Amphidinium_carterae.1
MLTTNDTFDYVYIMSSELYERLRAGGAVAQQGLGVAVAADFPSATEAKDLILDMARLRVEEESGILGLSQLLMMTDPHMTRGA